MSYYIPTLESESRHARCIYIIEVTSASKSDPEVKAGIEAVRYKVEARVVERIRGDYPPSIHRQESVESRLLSAAAYKEATGKEPPGTMIYGLFRGPQTLKRCMRGGRFLVFQDEEGADAVVSSYIPVPKGDWRDRLRELDPIFQTEAERESAKSNKPE